MANGKKSFVLYADYIQIFEQLTNDEAGSLVKHLFRYVNDQEPEFNDRLLKILFEPIKQQLKRDLKKWEHKREKLSEAGKASAEKRKNEQMSTNVEQPQQSQADPTVNATVTVTATVNDNTISDFEIGKTIEFCGFTLNRKYDNKKINDLWKGFLIQNTKKYFANGDKITHFRNWIKTQPYEQNKKENQSSGAAPLKRVS